MPQSELLSKVVRVLDDNGIQYMVTGSFASSLQGEPRMTHDIDLLVAIPPTAVDKLLESFPPPDFYLDRDAVTRAIRGRDMFNLLDVVGGDKVDFWIMNKDDPFDRSRFARRYEDETLGVRFMVSSPEDTILAKLKWAKASGGSEKQFADAKGVYELQFGSLDMQYVRRWAKDLGVEDLLARLIESAQVVE